MESEGRREKKSPVENLGSGDAGEKSMVTGDGRFATGSSWRRLFPGD